MVLNWKKNTLHKPLTSKYCALCYQVYAETLLHSGRGECIALANKTLCKTSQEGTLPQPKDPLAGTRIGYEKSVELVLEAAREYFNSSNDLSDNVMDLARYRYSA